MARIRKKYQMLSGVLNERTRRLWAAAEAEAIGYGGISRVVSATGLSWTTVVKGIDDLTEQRGTGRALPPDRVRRPGGGDKRLKDKDPTLLADLDALVEPATRGDPMAPLRWTCKSTRKLSDELLKQGHKASPQTVAVLLKEQGYSLQANSKTKEGKKSHPDRNAQFEHINETVKRFGLRGQPVISVDTKKKELVGNYKTPGREWRPEGEPEPVQMHDFPDPRVGKAIPYGVYDINNNEGWVNVGIDHDTPDFAVAAIRAWWKRMGSQRYTDATDLMITADSGGSNGARSRGWKMALQKLADETGIRITVCHFPPGTSKWNKIEHRMFSFISLNWKGQPLVSYEAVVHLIGATRTRAGLRVKARLDSRVYEAGVKIPEEAMQRIHLKPHDVHPAWNYTISPWTKVAKK